MPNDFLMRLFQVQSKQVHSCFAAVCLVNRILLSHQGNYNKVLYFRRHLQYNSLGYPSPRLFFLDGILQPLTISAKKSLAYILHLQTQELLCVAGKKGTNTVGECLL